MYSHSLIEKLRIPMSRILASVLILIIAVSSSVWEGTPLVASLLFLSGCVMVGISAMGRLWCSLYIAGYKDEKLVTLGPYSISRNPLYLFSVIGGVGVGLTTETLTIPSVIFVLFAFYYPRVIRSEEARLLSLYGERFQEYCAKTPSFFPGLRHLAEPETYVVNPRVFRRNIFGTLWFIWVIGILELIEGLHKAGVLPIYLRIY